MISTSDWHRSVIASLMMPERSQSYLEIGILRGECLTEVLPWCQVAMGVDINPECAQYVPDGVDFYNMPSDHFFEVYDGPSVDVIFIDGDHRMEQAARDFRNAVTILEVSGVIALHDSYPWYSPYEPPATNLCGDVYRFVEELKDDSNFNAVTIPRFPGVTLVTVNGN